MSIQHNPWTLAFKIGYAEQIMKENELPKKQVFDLSHVEDQEKPRVYAKALNVKTSRDRLYNAITLAAVTALTAIAVTYLGIPAAVAAYATAETIIIGSEVVAAVSTIASFKFGYDLYNHVGKFRVVYQSVKNFNDRINVGNNNNNNNNNT